MTLFQALLLGVLQGATEFLPISSSGHLVLFPWLLNWQLASEGNLAFDVLVHLGTLLAVIVYFWQDIVQILLAVWNGIKQRDFLGTENARLGWYIIIGSIPAGVIGILLDDWFESIFSKPLVAAIGLLITSGFLLAAERIGKKQATLKSMKWQDAVKIGMGQALAIMPGISRSGSTISTGLLLGINRSDAARFSFLLGIPVIASAGGLQLIRLFSEGNIEGQLSILVIGFISAAIVGYLAIRLLLGLVKRRSLVVFSYYCFILAVFSLVVYAIRV